MYAHIAHVAANRANTSPGTITSKSSSHPPGSPKLISAEKPTGFSSLPLELMGDICANLWKKDLTQFAQTCRYANDAAERRIWKHLNLVYDEPDLGVQWRPLGEQTRQRRRMSQNMYKELVLRLEERPELASSVHTLTIAAQRSYSNKLGDLLNLVGPTLREIDIRKAFGSRDLEADPTSQPWLIDLDQVFKSVKPLNRVTKMNLTLPFEWSKIWTRVLPAFPNLQELQVTTMASSVCSGDWDRVFGDFSTEPWPTYETYKPADPAPDKPADSAPDKPDDPTSDEPANPTPELSLLKYLKIKYMAIELEVAIMDLIKASASASSTSSPIIYLWLMDPGHTYTQSKAFKKFLMEWVDRGKLILEMELPGEDLEEFNYFKEEEELARQVAWEAECALYGVPELEEYYEEEMEPVTRQGEQDFGWEIYDDLQEESEGVVQEDL